jgi:hypothetical protein
MPAGQLNVGTDHCFGLLLLSFAGSCNALETLWPLSLSLVKQWLLQGWLEALDVCQSVGVIFATEAVIQQGRRKPALQLSQESLADEVGSCHLPTLPVRFRKCTCCTCCAVLHQAQHPRTTAAQLL